MSIPGLAVVLVAAIANTAVADDDDAAVRQIWQELTMFDSWADHAIEDAFYDNVTEDPARCRALIKDGNAAGLKASDSYDSGSKTYLWKRVAPICDRYEQLTRLAPVAKMAEAAIGIYAIVENSLLPENANLTIYAGNAADGTACVAAIDEAVAGVVPDGFQIRISYPLGQAGRATLVEARKLCLSYSQVSIKAAATRQDKEQSAENALRDKYAKHGIKGDRLAYLMESDNRFVMGKGCKTLDMAGKKKAKVLYEMQEGDTYWVVYKMTFKRDKLVSTSEKRFNKATSDGWRCK